MKQVVFILFTELLLHQFVMAQQPDMQKVKTIIPHQQITTGLSIPLAAFGETHYGGITAGYIRNKARFNDNEPYQRKKISWLTAATLSHFISKKENNGTVAFRYKGYSLLELNAGAAWHPVNKLGLSLRAGPAIGYYHHILRFTFTSTLQGSYTIGPKKVITPGITFVKEPGSDALWVASLQLGLLF